MHSSELRSRLKCVFDVGLQGAAAVKPLLAPQTCHFS